MPASDIDWATDQLRQRRSELKLYMDYYDGDHSLSFMTEKWRNTFGNLFRKLRDNLCPVVVDARAERMELIGWDGSLADKATENWTVNKMAVVTNEVHTAAFKAGDGFALVWPDKQGVARIYPQDPRQCVIEYDVEAPDVVTRAAKVWLDPASKKVRLNLYYSDHIEKYESRTKPTNGIPNKASSYVPLLELANDFDFNPLFHFGNRANLGCYGVSEMKHIIPIQDALNKSVCDMMIAGEFISFPQRWATGLEVEMDEDTGKVKNPPFTPGVDRVWAASGEVKFGQFDSGSVEGFILQQKDLRLEMGRLGAVPAHLIGITEVIPTGEGLKVSEGRLIKAVDNAKTAFGLKWIEIQAGCAVINGDVQNFEDALTPDALLPVWSSSSPHNPLLDAETVLVKVQVGMSKKQGLRELGYSDKKIEEMDTENDDAAAKAMEQAAAEAAAGVGIQEPMSGVKDQGPTAGGPAAKPTAFNRNGGPGRASKPAPKQQSRRPVGKR